MTLICLEQGDSVGPIWIRTETICAIQGSATGYTRIWVANYAHSFFVSGTPQDVVDQMTGDTDEGC